MRVQERQLVLVRLVVVIVGVAFLAVFGDPIHNRVALIGLLTAVATYAGLIPLLLRRLPVRAVASLGIVLDTLTVSAVVWLASNVPDAYLFYGIVILGTAIRFGMLAAIVASVAMGALYVPIILAGSEPDAPIRALPVRVLYLVTFGVVAGLSSRIIIGRAAENARLQQRLQAEEQAREGARERELLGRLSRDFGASFDRDATRSAVAAGAAPLLGDATILLTLDAAGRRLVPVAAAGADAGLVARWRARVEARQPKLGEGIIGSAAGTSTSRLGHTGAEELDPDGLRELDVDWILAVPILAGGRLLGILATAGTAGREADEAIRRMAEALADRAGPALQNAHLWSDLQERVVREQQAQRIKDDFLSVVSHELRTPLTSIQGYSQLLEARLRVERGASKEMAHVQVILSQVRRMRRLVDDLLDVNRMDRSGGVGIEPVDFDLAELLRDAVGRVSRAEPQRTIALTAPDRVPVHLDRERIDQIVSNLLENAVKYSPDGGQIGVVLIERGPEIEVSVSDCGMGIPPGQRDHVFERFYQADDGQGRRRFGGLGLGLAISRAIVDAHGGRIWASANEEAGRGTVMAFRLPRRATPPEGPHLEGDEDAPQFVHRRRWTDS